jgi:hypothetical protein
VVSLWVARVEGNWFAINNKNLQKARMERLVTNVRGHATTVYDAGSSHPHSAVHVDKIFRSVPMGAAAHPDRHGHAKFSLTCGGVLRGNRSFEISSSQLCNCPSPQAVVALPRNLIS